jgi:hypothetical protein
LMLPAQGRTIAFGIFAGLEPVGQRPVADPSAAKLALGPLVPVDRHLGRVREVGADLDEPDPEVRVPDVDVVDPDPPGRLRELERRDPPGCRNGSGPRTPNWNS